MGEGNSFSLFVCLHPGGGGEVPQPGQDGGGGGVPRPGQEGGGVPQPGQDKEGTLARDEVPPIQRWDGKVLASQVCVCSH